jgi:uncharacterized protein YdaU (DUF1376 family)
MSSSSKLPWFPFYPKDFLCDEKVMQMSAMECGAYIRLLCIAWNSQPIGTLAGSPVALARLAVLTDHEWQEHGDVIMAPFELIDGRWCQKRMMREGRSSEKKHSIFVEAGRRGGLAKACLKPASSNHNHNHNHKEEKSSSNGSGEPVQAALQIGLAPVKTPEKKKRNGPLMDEAAVERFKSNPAYTGIDVDKETWKFSEWCRNNGKLETIRRFTNWLNRIV